MYNQVVPAKVYIYPTADEMKKGLEFQDEQSKDLNFGLKETTFQAKNVLFISKGLAETDVRAIDKVRKALMPQHIRIFNESLALELS